mmetsp:Transcript_5383/g.18996  ORF Transcript_5383/g.18996 Transcript_5383/m.18996 type:complete len:116 (-) Transcript_5383:227-574(-)
MSDSEEEDPKFAEVIQAVQRSVGHLQSPTVTLSELKRHRTITDLWVVISGHVFNVTPLIDGSYGKRHPGGTEILKKLVNRMGDNHDVTQSFCKFHYPSGNAVKWMKDLHKGVASQ